MTIYMPVQDANPLDDTCYTMIGVDSVAGVWIVSGDGLDAFSLSEEVARDLHEALGEYLDDCRY